jgi:hypothetical protein
MYCSLERFEPDVMQRRRAMVLVAHANSLLNSRAAAAFVGCVRHRTAAELSVAVV